MFESTNRIRFLIPSEIADRNWWLSEIYDPHGLTPEGFGDRLAASWKGDKRMEVIEFNGEARRFAISMAGNLGTGQLWLVEHTLELNGSFLNADRMFVDSSHQQAGHGRRFMADAASLGKELQLGAIRLEADNIGRYVWLRCGFLPDRGSWTAMRAPVLQRIVEAREELGARRFTEVLQIADNPSPAAARELAALEDAVRSRTLLDHNARPLEVPLGKAIFIEASPIWSGSLDLTDEASLAVLRNYIGTET